MSEIVKAIVKRVLNDIRDQIRASALRIGSTPDTYVMRATADLFAEKAPEHPLIADLASAVGGLVKDDDLLRLLKNAHARNDSSFCPKEMCVAPEESEKVRLRPWATTASAS